jgi:ribonuclease HII
MKTIFIDEAGRWPLAWPLHVGLLFVTKKTNLRPYKDSKKCSPVLRERLFQNIQSDPHITFAVGISTAAYIDKHGLTKALQAAILSWLKKLWVTKNFQLVIDGNHDFGLTKKLWCDVKTVIHGDDLIPEISAASIVAKVTRDVYMMKMHKKFPAYHFDQHKWYGTKKHYAMLKKYGPSKIHRMTFL